ncbi:DUF4919 domain-containing protein [Janibacter sp. G349]|uniref:DUF4919 domain-containing protein n=1 Tax=unclassified Janibacter TaxID=2649294 RepID=UPI0020CDE759|nr:DUF4919 domain-containing protein [Janibacter sp. CX7]UTT66020.1 DUF4919 domain-containing protein [Janibacter sp. CX7]
MTGATTLTDLVGAYVHDPQPERLRELRSVVRGSPTFDPDLDVAAVVGTSLDDGRASDTIRALTGKMPGAALNPRAHAVLASAFEEVGDEAAARRERLMAQLSITSILSTGDGTRERPWSVLRVADEYDVLRAKNIRPVQQAVLQADGRVLDGHEDAAGGRVWFALEDARSLGGEL